MEHATFGRHIIVDL